VRTDWHANAVPGIASLVFERGRIFFGQPRILIFGRQVVRTDWLPASVIRHRHIAKSPNHHIAKWPSSFPARTHSCAQLGAQYGSPIIASHLRSLWGMSDFSWFSKKENLSGDRSPAYDVFMKCMPPLWFVCLVVAYIAVALINRQFGWAWGREWAAPTLMLCVIAATLIQMRPGCRRMASDQR
jgi:hypothetical protein